MVQVIMKIEIHRIKYSISTRNKRVYPLFLLCMCVGGKVKSNRSLLAILECVGGSVYPFFLLYMCGGEGSIPALLVIHLCEGEYPSIHLCAEGTVSHFFLLYMCVCGWGGKSIFLFLLCVYGGKSIPFLLVIHVWVGKSIPSLVIHVSGGEYSNKNLNSVWKILLIRIIGKQ